MKKLPIGRQHFAQLIEEDLVYVDKTKLIYELVADRGYYFFSRPRRFGKSLLIETLKNIYLGNQELFKGLWIYDKIEWKEHPVIHLDFSQMDYFQPDLTTTLNLALEQIAEQQKVILKTDTPVGKFQELIETLSKKRKIAILIDEYDKPITDNIIDLEQANINRKILRQFYSILKPLGDKLELLFITGIAKFSQVSLFSVLNNIHDITLSRKYATLTGITHEELLTYFSNRIKKIGKEIGYSEEKLLANIKEMYNGYSWDGKNFVYNPFSLLSFLRDGTFHDYWFKTGTPTFLIEILRRGKMTGDELKEVEVDDYFFNQFDISQGIDSGSLLFQTGYLTIKKIVYDEMDIIYTLSYPNREVQKSFLMNLIEVYTFKKPGFSNSFITKLKRSLKTKNIKLFREQLNILLADISHHLFPFEKKKDKTKEREKQEFMAWEGYFHTIVYLVLQFIGISIQCEISKHKGRIDAVIQTDKYIYIMEFNPDSYREKDAKAALKQIKDQQYAASYQNTNKEVILMGVAFDRAKKEVKPIEWENR